ncbi:M10 family metallopeptidase C-terminal domain-containing protein [Shinella sp. CPCC 101442]|uniref:M10 family metallopeptidase n=1 Tax=Shinella sp. CPCC 101442 TaxID=2932265 RepID=UPI002152F665|nr:M10 family metallopeptidase [Shinella sp. CPCC 101442]MCR6501849.1 M10 family metallopeptidase C-terminal domain-containing protein [Shinella sp. CPCC 101442]
MSGSATTTKNINATGSIFVDSLLVGKGWSASTVTYAFPTVVTDYSYSKYNSGFSTISYAQKNTALFAMETSFGGKANDGFSVEGFTNLNFTVGNSTNATFRFAQSSVPGTAEVADFPGNVINSDSADDGDIWFGTADAGTIYDLRKPVAGNYAWHTLIHELGHALGLKHAQEDLVYGKMPDATNSIEFTVMSYRTYIGDTNGYYSYEEFGAPQTFMMADIAALQHMYGADYSTNSGATVYKWTPGSGDTLVNGELAIAPGENRIFATLWDGGGNDTYDLSAYTNGVKIDLRPGEHSVFDAAQLAYLSGGPNGGFARGNIFNALLFKGDLRSLIENATGGSGNDTIRGNQAVNSISGNNGADALFGLDGNDTLNGGAGADQLDGGNGNDTLLGGAAADTLIGGAGTDTASYSNATKGVVANLATPSSNTNDAAADTYSSIENLTGTNFVDRLVGSTGDNNLRGGDGADTLDGGTGNDTLNGGTGGDTLIGGFGTDTANYSLATIGVTASLANAGVNTNEASGDTYSSIENLFGSAFGDKLIGNAGLNRIAGYTGNDTLTGGSAGDIFVFASGYGRDTITDFQNNVDDIDLQSYNFSSASSVLSKAVQVGADLEIRLSSVDVLILKQFTKASLDATDLIL